MLTKIAKWGSVAVLLVAAMSWHAGANYRLLLDFVFCVGAIMILKQAVRTKEYLWASGFVGLALFLNPIVPVLAPASNLMLLLFLLCLAPLVLTFTALFDATITLYPNLITDLNPRGESIRPTSECGLVARSRLA